MLKRMPNKLKDICRVPTYTIQGKYRYCNRVVLSSDIFVYRTGIQGNLYQYFRAH